MNAHLQVVHLVLPPRGLPNRLLTYEPDNILIDASSIQSTRLGTPTLLSPVLRTEPLLEESLFAPIPKSTSPKCGSPKNEYLSTPKHAYKGFQPVTPCRSPSPEDGSSAETPAWARPLHLVDANISIFKQVHGDKAQEHPLCLCCFRQHGQFRRIVQHGCEICGQQEVLEGHYWEAPSWSQ